MLFAPCGVISKSKFPLEFTTIIATRGGAARRIGSGKERMMEKQQVFELSRHGEEFRIYIENMNRLDVMASLSKFLRGLADRKILDAEDILVCLLTGIDAKEMIDATDEMIRRLIIKKMKEGMRDDKRFS